MIGAGVDQVPVDLPTDVRDRFAIGDTPFVVCVGRLDPAKGMHELASYFREFRRRRAAPLKLVLIGSELVPIEPHEDIVVTGFVDDLSKWALIAESSVLAQPSYFESFSLSLAEGWRCAKPALVQGRNDVLAGQARRSRGALSYRCFAEFAEALKLILDEPSTAAALGGNGADYVTRYDWDTTLDNFERLLVDTTLEWQRTHVAPRTAASAGPVG